MPILVTADLHLDIWLQAGRDPLAALEPAVWPSLDALIVAGDLGNKPKTRWPKLIAHLARYITPERIHILPGNHDYYDHAIDGEDRLARLCTEAGARFIQKAEFVIGATRALTCTLWTDFALHGDTAAAQRLALQRMNDYRHIRHAGAGYRRLRHADTALIHADHRAWLETRLAAPFPGRTIVITHHCPHPGMIGAQRTALDPVYASNLLPLITRYQPHAWLFGHTHHHAEATVGSTTLRNVSLGYPDQVEPDEEPRIIMRGMISEP